MGPDERMIYSLEEAIQIAEESPPDTQVVFWYSNGPEEVTFRFERSGADVVMKGILIEWLPLVVGSLPLGWRMIDFGLVKENGQLLIGEIQ